MKKLVIYLTFMYPNEKEFYATLDMLEEQSVDIVEFGVPVVNPHLDGEAIQKSHQQVLTNGLTATEFKKHLENIRAKYDFEITLMTYETGVKMFNLLNLSENLYDGILCVDAMLEKNSSSKLVQLFNEEMSLKECRHKLANSTQFNYVMSGVGKTGSFTSVPEGYLDVIPILKSFSKIENYVGFGIKTPEDVATVIRQGADGVIIGSHFMTLMETKGLAVTKDYITSLQAVL